jgi:predicted amidohydrolase
MKLPFKAACLQFNPVLAQKQRNIDRLYDLALAAASGGAKLIVTPEMATTGYHFADRSAIRDLVEPIPGPTTDRFGEICRRYGAYIVISLPEVDLLSGLYYISAAVIGPKGVIGKYRKMHLWEAETRWAAPGNLGMPVFETELGRLSVNICMDSTFFESARMAALQGADLLAFPTNSSGQSLAVLKFRAQQNGLYIAAANRAGKEMDFHMVGGSAIWDPFGHKLAEGDIYGEGDPADALPDSIVYGTVDPALYINERKNMLRERRPELYHDLMLDLAAWDPVKENPSRHIHAAVVQMTPVPGDKASNLRKMEQYIGWAAEAAGTGGLDVIIFPELALTGMPAGLEPAAIRRLAESMDGEAVAHFQGLAAKHRVHLVFGFLEWRLGELYQSVVLINPEGEIEGLYRKTHLTSEERRWAAPGNAITICHSRKLGRVGLLAGHDANFPETAGLMAVHRADLLIVLTANPKLERMLPSMQAVAQSSQVYTLVSGFSEGSGLYGSDSHEGLDQTEVMQPGERLAFFHFPTRPAGRWFHQHALLAARRTQNYTILSEVKAAADYLV